MDKINNKTHNDIVAENIIELNTFDINDTKDTKDINISDSIDGEEYVIIAYDNDAT